MGRGPKWSQDQLEDAARLFEAGVGPLEMVNLRPHWPLSTVKKLHAKLKKDVPLVRDVTITVAQSWSADARAGLEAFLDANPQASIAEVTRHLRAEYGLRCHRTTVWRAMKQHFTPFKKVKCQKISAANTEKRMNFALRMSLELRAFTGRTRISKRVTPLDLARVWFADEKMFRLSVRPCPQNQRVWLRRSESKTEHLRSDSSAKLRVQSSQAESLQGVMVALAVNLVHGFSPVYIVREHCKVSAAAYQEILRNHFVPYCLSKSGPGFVWQHDNAPSHAARATLRMMAEEMTAAHGVRVLSWPPSSPDLQPLDYTYWSHITMRIGRTYTKTELIAKLITEVDRMNAEWDTHRKGIEPEFSRRLALLAAANGGHFE